MVGIHQLAFQGQVDGKSLAGEAARREGGQARETESGARASNGRSRGRKVRVDVRQLSHPTTVTHSLIHSFTHFRIQCLSLIRGFIITFFATPYTTLYLKPLPRLLKPKRGSP